MNATYHGESGRSAYYRINQHLDDISKVNNKNAFVKHCVNKHHENIGDPDIYEFKVVSTFSSCLDKQVQEAVNITKDQSDELLNSKAEYHQPSLTRITTTREVNAVRNRGSL